MDIGETDSVFSDADNLALSEAVRSIVEMDSVDSDKTDVDSLALPGEAEKTDVGDPDWASSDVTDLDGVDNPEDLMDIGEYTSEFSDIDNPAPSEEASDTDSLAPALIQGGQSQRSLYSWGFNPTQDM